MEPIDPVPTEELLLSSLMNSGMMDSGVGESRNSLPPEAKKKMQAWIRSRHLICSGHFYVFETVDYGAIDRFTGCIEALGGTLISVALVGKVWMGDHRQVVLYRARASLHTPCHALKQYWIKYGSFRTRFDEAP